MVRMMSHTTSSSEYLLNLLDIIQYLMLLIVGGLQSIYRPARVGKFFFAGLFEKTVFFWQKHVPSP